MSPEILDKIKKLLRLGKSTNPHEAAIAMQRAFELANRHGVDVTDIDLDDSQLENMVLEYFPSKRRLSHLRKLVIAILTSFFRVKVYWTCSRATGPRVAFGGRQSDVQIAGYVHDFLITRGEAGLRDFIERERRNGRAPKDREKKNWVSGFIYGISSQLKETEATFAIDDNKRALIVSEEKQREKFMQEQLGKAHASIEVDKPKPSAPALWAGYERGVETKINSPLNGGNREALALTN